MGGFVPFHRRVMSHPRGFLDNLFRFLLLPFGMAYGLIGLVREQLYRHKLLSSYRAPIPVISVGNLTAGGTGKTPVVDHLIKFFQDRAVLVAVVSRGYGGRTIRPVEVVSSGNGPLLSPEIVGDEPFLLAQRNPQALVFVSRRRADGIRMAASEFGARIIILDDGFQHLAVERDLDIVLLDARRPLDNGWPLPAGMLREFPGALRRRGDLFLVTRAAASSRISPQIPAPAFLCRHILEDRVFSLSGEESNLDRLCGKIGVAFAGIAHPEEFFEDLRERGLNLVETLAFPDHAWYGQAALGRICQAANQAEYLITTEKDAVKISPSMVPVPCYRTLLRIEFPQGGDVLEKALTNLLPGGDDRGPE
jgi:tetraacyldisaccharide 4'-kinase